MQAADAAPIASRRAMEETIEALAAAEIRAALSEKEDPEIQRLRKRLRAEEESIEDQERSVLALRKACAKQYEEVDRYRKAAERPIVEAGVRRWLALLADISDFMDAADAPLLAAHRDSFMADGIGGQVISLDFPRGEEHSWRPSPLLLAQWGAKTKQVVELLRRAGYDV